MTEAQKKRQRMDRTNEWVRNRYKSFSLRYNLTTEKAIVEHIEKQGSPKAYFTRLILEDMEKKSKLGKKKNI